MLQHPVTETCRNIGAVGSLAIQTLDSFGGSGCGSHGPARRPASCTDVQLPALRSNGALVKKTLLDRLRLSELGGVRRAEPSPAMSPPSLKASGPFKLLA